jgi:uncharacterized repeat protein (TIGR01451 family)
MTMIIRCLSSFFACSIVASAVLAIAGTSHVFVGTSSSTQSADVKLEVDIVQEPAFWRGRFFYGFAIRNLGPSSALDVLFVDDIPDGLLFSEISAYDNVRNEYFTEGVTHPVPGERGRIQVWLPQLPASGEIFLVVYLSAAASPGTEVTNAVSVGSSTSDPVLENNTLVIRHVVPIPPLIERVKSVGDPFRIVVLGAGFVQNSFDEFPQITVGDSVDPIPREFKSRNRLVLRGGRDLKRLFPRGVPVLIRVANPDGGEAFFEYTR